MGLLLQAVDAAAPLRWRWLLIDEETGAPLADHRVNLDSSPDEVMRFADIYGYVRSFAAPDRRVGDGERIVADAGAWAGSVLLGESVGEAIIATAMAGPVTVRVVAAPPTDLVLLWPLELAHAGGSPLASRGDVSFVYDIGQVPSGQKDAVSGELRLLAVFSQPTQTSVLALRRERYALSRLIRRLGRARAKVMLKIAQYGVTRERLSEIAEDGDGWDVLHLSGHGAGGAFLLEKADGSGDLVPSADLVAMLRPARRRVKLAVVSACESAADATAETYRLLGLTQQALVLEAQAGTGRTAAVEVPGLARALARELGCAVVGMRYPVTDEFAIAFGDVLYEQLLDRRQPVDLAVARAIAAAAAPGVSAARPAVSVATPGIFGAVAAGLRLPVPRGRPLLDPAEQRMAYFPDEPPRFVGRAAAMAKASVVLAPSSGKTTVLLHGMAGAGKTACALELAYRHQDAFAALAFWQAPTRADEWASALPDLASRLDIQLSDYGFTMAGAIGTDASLRAFLPRLRSVMAGSGVLLVLDNLETLLTPEGTWRDPRWDMLMTALTGHAGESRLILTSRVAPAGLLADPGRLEPELADNVSVVPVHALSLGESASLARELPNLRRLLHADAGPIRAEAWLADADRELVRRVLRVVQGHPKLMELADAMAIDPARLDTQLTSAEQAAIGQELDAFFRSGTSTLDPEEFLPALNDWTRSVLGVLSPATRLMAEFVVCLENSDRRSDVIEANWPDLWRRLGHTDDPPVPDSLLTALADAALIEAEPAAVHAQGEGGTRAQIGPAKEPMLMTYRVHPGVAAAIADIGGTEVQQASDAQLATYWPAISDRAREQDGGEDTGMVVRAALASAPYLLRRGDLIATRMLLDRALMRDESPGTAQVALPVLRRIADATGTPKDLGILARALRGVDPGETERLMRKALEIAIADGDYRFASGATGDLVNMLIVGGRLAEALQAAGRKPEFTRLAGLGPWIQLADQGQRLQVLGLMGEHERVLAEVESLRATMADLPPRQSSNDPASPWHVREFILDIGRSSAQATKDWERCLELNAEIQAVKQQRHAGEHEVARSLLNDAVPLIRLGRLEEAERLLANCQQVFEDHADSIRVARVLSTRAYLEDARTHWEIAADLERTALRLFYVRPEPLDIATSHHNLANYLGRRDNLGADEQAHRMAAALIRRLSGTAHDLADTVRVLTDELSADSPTVPLPSTVTEVVAVVEQTEGVHLAALLGALEPDPAAVEAVLSEVLTVATADAE